MFYTGFSGPRTCVDDEPNAPSGSVICADGGDGRHCSGDSGGFMVKFEFTQP